MLFWIYDIKMVPSYLHLSALKAVVILMIWPNISYAYLSDAMLDVALGYFLDDAKITTMYRETNQRWSCGRYMMGNGCNISIIKFAFTEINKSIVLHWWIQCKTIPFYGNHMSPTYLYFSLSTDEEELK